MNPLLGAAHPLRNASVAASAGTGKTWLLVTRMIRLLLAGARPDALLAVTFTRKAAAEMQSRLLDALREFASVPDTTLAAGLAAIDVEPTPELVRAARRLHESVLRTARVPRTTTFHSFCHDVLKRFPLEADVTPGFELIESTQAVERDAVQALYAEATLDPDGGIAAALESLYDRFGHTSTEEVLRLFLDRRSEWWAFTKTDTDTPARARERLRSLLRVDSNQHPAADPFARHEASLREFADLLERNDTPTNQAYATQIRDALISTAAADARFESILPVFLTTGFAPRARKQSNAQAKRMGSVAEQRFLSLHEQLSEAFMAWVDARRALATLELSSAWYVAGQRLLELFQRIKEERRLLDFADLEWKTFVLLASNGHAHWVQYKLDQRIDHLLIDEFQDTNPIQWHMLLPLLQELAGGGDRRNRSVFIVGDDKQSIYQFRRADPRLFRVAQEWLATTLEARSYSLDSSRRSAPAIARFVNAVFDRPEARDVMPDFPAHETHRHDLWGHVEVLPLAEWHDDAEPQPAATTQLRNPLLQPRTEPVQTVYDLEAASIARKVLELVNGGVPIGPRGAARAATFSDVLILLRSRTHVAAYERALRAAHIPFAGAERGTLLQSREISDLVDLLDVLATPFNNLAFATVLRSPLFCCTEEHLSRLAMLGDGGSWAERLAALALSLDAQHPLHRAHRWLSRWSAAAGHLPVHDLIDRIYSEGRVVKRYLAAAPPHLRASVRGNLEQFVDLALELDSGRYPSLGRFVESTRAAQRGIAEAPDADTLCGNSQGVRVMTIHAAKGLEAPIVFVADATSDSPRSPVANVFIAWDPLRDRPDCLYLAGSKSGFDPVSRELAADNDRRRSREDLNLLYVALTRAKQMLFVSGSESKKGRAAGWYELARNGLVTLTGSTEIFSYSDADRPPPVRVDTIAPIPPAEAAPAELGQPVPSPGTTGESAPSQRDIRGTTQAADAAAVERGVAIHRLIELLSNPVPVPEDPLRAHVVAALGRETDAVEFSAWLDEARRVVDSPNLATLFDRTRYVRAYSEVPLTYTHAGRVVNGVIDRLVVRDNEIAVVDFKTHRVASADAARNIAGEFREQLEAYARGAAALWPGRSVRTFVVFTALAEAVELGAAT